MDFMKNKAKFQEDPDTGITFDDVAVSPASCPVATPACMLINTTHRYGCLGDAMHQHQHELALHWAPP